MVIGSGMSAKIGINNGEGNEDFLVYFPWQQKMYIGNFLYIFFIVYIIPNEAKVDSRDCSN